MKKLYLKLGILFFICISGCASFGPFDPKPGMSIKQVSEQAYVPCNGSMRINDDHITFVRQHLQVPEVSIYQTNAHVKYNRASPDCQKELYFYNGKLISIEQLNILANKIKTVDNSHSKNNNLRTFKKENQDNVLLKQRFSKVRDQATRLLNIDLLVVVGGNTYKCENFHQIPYSVEVSLACEKKYNEELVPAMESKRLYDSKKASENKSLTSMAVSFLQQRAINVCQVFYQGCQLYDSELTVSGQIRNNLNAPIKDFVLTCNYVASSGTVIDNYSKKIFQSIDSNSTRYISFKVPIVEQGSPVCKVSRFIGSSGSTINNYSFTDNNVRGFNNRDATLTEDFNSNPLMKELLRRRKIEFVD